MKEFADARFRILITGAAGFIGRCIVAHIRRKQPSAEVILLDRSLPGRHGIDLRDTAGVRDLIGKRALTHVVHASGGHPYLSNDVQFETHVAATRSLLDALAGQSAHLRFINIGSSSQYGRQDSCVTPLLPESNPDQPLSVYAKSKMQQEQLIERAAQSGALEAVYLRLFNPIGVGEKETFVVPNLIAQILASKNETVRFRIRDPDSQRDFVDVRDAAAAVCAAMATPGAVGEKLNVCSGRATRISDLARLLARVAGRGCVVAGTADYQSEIPYQRGDWRRIHDLCGWKPTHSLTESLTHIWQASCVQT